MLILAPGLLLRRSIQLISLLFFYWISFVFQSPNKSPHNRFYGGIFQFKIRTIINQSNRSGLNTLMGTEAGFSLANSATIFPLAGPRLSPDMACPPAKIRFPHFLLRPR